MLLQASAQAGGNLTLAATGGLESGQGLNTQVVQAVVLARLAAKKLGTSEANPVAYVRRLLRTQKRLEGRSFAAFAGPVLVLVFSKLLSFLSHCFLVQCRRCILLCESIAQFSSSRLCVRHTS